MPISDILKQLFFQGGSRFKKKLPNLFHSETTSEPGGGFAFPKNRDPTAPQVYYAYKTSNPAEGQWDANSAVMGNVPAPCVPWWY